MSIQRILDKMNNNDIYIGKILRKVPGYSYIAGTKVWKALRYKITLKASKRKNDNYTQFLRLPTQYLALTEIIKKNYSNKGAEVRVCVLGCSDGSEPYSIASIMINVFPEFVFKIDAYDLENKVIDKAMIKKYNKEQIFDNKMITEEFINNTFNVTEDIYEVKEYIARKVKFDVLDATDFQKCASIGYFDIVFAQNFLCHLNRSDAIQAFENIYKVMKANSILFIDGIDLNLKQKVTSEKGLVPFDYQIEKIHNEARRTRGGGWPYHYWGLEPFSDKKLDWRRRYSTIFLRMT